MTYGFEIEGNFQKDLSLVLGNKWKYKTDGSVSIPSIYRSKVFKDPYNNVLIKNNYTISELNSPVFKNFKKMAKALAIFKKDKNWIANSSCGIHIHIGFKNDKNKKQDLADFNVIKDLQDYAVKELCDCVQDRIKNNHFCQPYNIKNFNYDYSDFKSNKKYSFMGNHSLGTFEFRFFSACDHKDDNAKKFFRFLDKRLKDYKFKTEQKYVIGRKKTMKINDEIKNNDGFFEIKDKIESNNKELRLNYNLESKTEPDIQGQNAESPFVFSMPYNIPAMFIDHSGNLTGNT